MSVKNMQDSEAPAQNVSLTDAGRKTQHYAMVSYNDTINWPNCFGRNKMIPLKKPFKEERTTDAELEKIGMRLVKCAG